MVDNLTGKVQASQNKFEALVSRLPGFAGYKQKEQRREADKLLRLHVARQYQEQLNRLGGIQHDLASRGDLMSTLTLERGVTKLQLLIDRLKTASYGYAGLFDALKVDEEVLDELYAFDQGMLEGVERLSALLDALAEAASGGEAPSGQASALVTELEALNNAFSRRQDVILK